MRNESETRAELIDPALAAAGWGTVLGSVARREFIFTKGRLEGAGRRAKPLIADYVLVYRNTPLAIIEAKQESLAAAEGVAQAKDYAARLCIRFAFATNGHQIYRMDLKGGQEGEVTQYPDPQTLWNLTFADHNDWRDRFAAVPYEDRSGSWEVRYYQSNAIGAVLAAIAQGRQRILLTLATGTGKTAIAFQIAWKLFHAQWNLGRKPLRRPRILFLADRNILANQAFNAFGQFAEDARVRIKPGEIKKTGKVPTNASIFFTIFQTFLSGPEIEGKPSPYFGQYPPDFFDFIVIDECHRGGANDESTWRAILDYFTPAVQLGLTATPKRTVNVDTYNYFGEPVYTYSLKDGINDGFLTPFKVRQIATTIDEYVYTPDDLVLEGEVKQGHRYTESDFNQSIFINDRERYRLNVLMDEMGEKDKTIIFCANQAHAAAVRDMINQRKKTIDLDFCVRVTAKDGEAGEQFLREFQDDEKSIPTILTTSHKLATGVDAPNCRNIVLLRPIHSMIEFKQIIGRGTRLFAGKDFFTIYDFVKAHHHFADREWDGEPLEPEPKPPAAPRPPDAPGPGDPDAPDAFAVPGQPRPQPLVIQLADGKARQIQHMSATSFWSPDGQPMSATQFIESLFGVLPALFKDEDELRKLWSVPSTREKLLLGLEERGFGPSALEQAQALISAENSDLFDVLAYIRFALPPVTRQARADGARPGIQSSFTVKQQAFLAFVLDHYVAQGTHELDGGKLSELVLLRYGSVSDGVLDLGAHSEIRDVFTGFQKYLFLDSTPSSPKGSISPLS